MFCPYCGKQKADGVAVCPYCGNVDYEESEMATRIIPENMQLDVQPQGMYNQNMMRCILLCRSPKILRWS